MQKSSGKPGGKKPLLLQNKVAREGHFHCGFAMKKKDSKQPPLMVGEEKAGDRDKRESERRVEHQKGFAYISTVGWICRREKCRRKHDHFECKK